jgi:dTDP-4-dehydrorhamnose 3,5-epimerase
VKIPIQKDHLSALTFQQYGPAAAIEGVFSTPLKKHRDLEGSFMEYVRLSEGAVEGLARPFVIHQISLSHAQPGRINAFHVHPKEVQDELWCVIAGSLLVWLVDVREQSATCGRRQWAVLSGESPVLLHIPAGVAHGFKAGSEGALLLYAASTQFNPSDPNEGRLPWDHFGAQLWEQDRG